MSSFSASRAILYRRNEASDRLFKKSQIYFGTVIVPGLYAVLSKFLVLTLKQYMSLQNTFLTYSAAKVKILWYLRRVRVSIVTSICLSCHNRTKSSTTML